MQQVQIPYRTLSNGSQIPEIGIGCWDAYGETVSQAIAAALQLGYRLVDSAMYYKNEPEVGAGIRNSGIPREEIFLSSKIWYTDMVKERVRPTFEKSLKDLGVDYLDMYMLHWPVGDVRGSWKILEGLYEEGLVKNLGICNCQMHHLQEIAAYANIPPVINQVESHPTFQQDALVRYTLEQGIAAEAWGPLGKGKDLNADIIVALAEKYGKSPAQIILRWHLQRGLLIIPKSIHPERMVQNTELYDFSLTPEEVAAIHTLETGETTRGYAEGYIW